MNAACIDHVLTKVALCDRIHVVVHAHEAGVVPGEQDSV